MRPDAPAVLPPLPGAAPRMRTTAAQAASGPTGCPDGSCETRIQEILPKILPGAPLMPARYAVNRSRRQRRCQQLMRLRKTIIVPESEVKRLRVGRPCLEVAPYSALRVCLRKVTRLPGTEPRRRGNLGGQLAIAQVGRQQAQTVELAGISGGIVERNEAAQRN